MARGSVIWGEGNKYASGAEQTGRNLDGGSTPGADPGHWSLNLNRDGELINFRNLKQDQFRGKDHMFREEDLSAHRILVGRNFTASLSGISRKHSVLEDFTLEITLTIY